MSSNAQTIRALREKAAANGLCIECRCRDAKQDCMTCQHCLDRHYARRRDRKRRGLCECGATPRTDAVRCNECIERDIARQSKNWHEAKLLGLCPLCHKRAVDGQVLCEWHRRHNAQRARNRRRVNL